MLLKKILILNAAFALSLALSTPLLAGPTHVGNGLVEEESDSGGKDIGNGITIDMKNRIASSGSAIHVRNG
ncbi:MAG: hypothetical protein Q3M24_21570 [Candidatus Electrothrix aestuarii]|uniref:Uncharacterized protein n=1 Tax=Candidatus Electrothrix aestuarii TaxID=3062594 RepID=A0AAU8LVG0_9BACT|nr:hypothetical protein [Candidatus Electrothrix aestuarii]